MAAGFSDDWSIKMAYIPALSLHTSESLVLIDIPVGVFLRSAGECFCTPQRAPRAHRGPTKARRLLRYTSKTCLRVKKKKKGVSKMDFHPLEPTSQRFPPSRLILGHFSTRNIPLNPALWRFSQLQSKQNMFVWLQPAFPARPRGQGRFRLRSGPTDQI